MSTVDDNDDGMTASFSASTFESEVNDPWTANTRGGLNPIDLSTILCTLPVYIAAQLLQTRPDPLLILQTEQQTDTKLLLIILPCSRNALTGYLHNSIRLGPTFRRKGHCFSFEQDLGCQWSLTSNRRQGNIHDLLFLLFPYFSSSVRAPLFISLLTLLCQATRVRE